MIDQNQLCDDPSGSTGVATLEAARDSAADALEGAASTLQEKRGTVSSASNIVRELSNRLEDILHDIVSDIQEIVRSEIRLAKVELGEQVGKAAKAAGMFAAGAILGLHALGFLMLACVYALAIALPSWTAAQIVCVLSAIVAGAFVVTGRKGIKRVHAGIA